MPLIWTYILNFISKPKNIFILFSVIILISLCGMISYYKIKTTQQENTIIKIENKVEEQKKLITSLNENINSYKNNLDEMNSLMTKYIKLEKKRNVTNNNISKLPDNVKEDGANEKYINMYNSMLDDWVRPSDSDNTTGSDLHKDGETDLKEAGF